MTEFGFDKKYICDIIQNRLQDNPDLKYYINNDYIEQLVNLLIDGVAEAIERNTQKAFTDLENKIRYDQRWT